jgi:hypothetical protein
MRRHGDGARATRASVRIPFFAMGALTISFRSTSGTRKTRITEGFALILTATPPLPLAGVVG